jgi:hypothetical protein
MSDVVAPVAPTTTTATEGAAAPAPAPTVTEAPKTAADFLARINSNARGTVAPSPAATTTTDASVVPTPDTNTVTVDASGRAHGSDGKFVPKPQAGAEPAADAVTTTTSAGGEPAPEVVKLALPEGHPLRDRGITELPFAVPKEHEEILRSLVNEPVRKQQLAQAYEAARVREREAAEARAEAEFWRQNAGSVFTPEFYAKYQDIKQTYGDADAERYKRAVLAEAQGQLDQQVGTARVAQQIRATADAFRSAAMQDAQQRFPGWVTTNERGELVPTPEMEVAFRSYGAFISGTGKTEPSAADWYTIAEPLYDRSPAGQQRRAAEAQRIATEAAARAQREAAERERQALEAAAAGRKINPLGGVPNVQTGLSVPGTSDGPKTAQEFLARTRDRARGMA